MIRVMIAIFFFVFSGIVILQRCKPKETSNEPNQPRKNEFIGDQSCKSCHAHEYNEWLQSHHFMAMQPPNDSTVKGDFSDAVFTGDGVTSRFFKKDGKFFINTQGDDGVNHDYEVKYTFGFTPLQQYLVEFPGGRMQVPRVSSDTRQKNGFTSIPARRSHRMIGCTGSGMLKTGTLCVLPVILPTCRKIIILIRIVTIQRLV